MATVATSSARHPSPFAKSVSRMPPTHHRPAPSQSHSATSSSRTHDSQRTQMPDPYYGHEDIAKVAAHFVTHLFQCPELPTPSASNPNAPCPPLGLFIAYALHRTRLHASVTFSALFLLQRLKARFPAARGSSGHRLFISAFMLASKVMCDDTYSNKSWSIVGQGMFALREINQMEREMCSYLEWQLNVDPAHLKEFEQKVRKDFRGPGPYPTYSLPVTATTPMPSTTPYTQGGAPQNPPSFVSGRPAAPSTSPPKPAGPVHHHPIANAPLPPAAPYAPASSPGTPDTPEAYHSNSTSPASSGSPPTPPGHEDHTAKIVSSDPYPISTDARSIPGAAPQKPSSRQRTSPSEKDKFNNVNVVVGAAGVPATSLDETKLKAKTEFLAFAQPIDW